MYKVGRTVQVSIERKAERGRRELESTAMASPFADLEFLMDHNMKLASSASAVASSLQEAFPSSPLPPAEQPQQQTLTLNLHRHSQETLALHHRPSALASLSLAFGPILSSPLLFNRIISKPRVSFLNAIDSSVVKLPSQKKCVSPMPVMPAISALNVMDPAMAGSSSPDVGTKKKFSIAFPDYHRLPDRGNSFGNPSDGGAMRKASIVWFRSDLRCHDNEALFTASKESLSVLPVYVFDPRECRKSSSGFDKTGRHRARFLLQCVSDLREKLKELGSDLVVRVGKPEEVLLSLAKAIGADALYAHQEVSYDEMQAEKKVSAALQEEGVDVKYFWGNTLFHVDDLPFKLEDMPTTYSAFYEKVQNVSVREIVETPKQFKGLPIRGGVKPGDMPGLEELSVKSASSQRKEVSSVATPLIGGEKEALQRLGRLAADHARQSSNKADCSVSVDSLYGSNFSSKISPWLALGCLSPRHVFEELRNKETSGVSVSMESNVSENRPNWLVFELLWRDFFRFITKKSADSRFGTEATKATSTAAAIPA